MTIRPLHDWAVIKRVDARRAFSKIIIPDSAQGRPSEGVIEAIGPGAFVRQEGTGKKKHFTSTTVKPVQTVFFTDYMAKEVNIGVIEVTLIRERDILGAFEQEEETNLRKSFSGQKKSMKIKIKRSVRKKTKPSATKATVIKGAEKKGTLKGPAEERKKPPSRSKTSFQKARSRNANTIKRKVAPKKVRETSDSRTEDKKR